MPNMTLKGKGDGLEFKICGFLAFFRLVPRSFGGKSTPQIGEGVKETTNLLCGMCGVWLSCWIWSNSAVLTIPSY